MTAKIVRTRTEVKCAIRATVALITVAILGACGGAETARQTPDLRWTPSPVVAGDNWTVTDIRTDLQNTPAGIVGARSTATGLEVTLSVVAGGPACNLPSISAITIDGRRIRIRMDRSNAPGFSPPHCLVTSGNLLYDIEIKSVSLPATIAFDDDAPCDPNCGTREVTVTR